MLISRNVGNSFGGEYGSDADFPYEMIRANPEQIAEVLYRYEFQIIELSGKVGDV